MLKLKYYKSIIKNRKRTSKFFGVSATYAGSPKKKWRAQIYANGLKINLGVYLSQMEAGMAFNLAHDMIGSSYYSIRNRITEEFLPYEKSAIETKVTRALLNRGAIIEK